MFSLENSTSYFGQDSSSRSKLVRWSLINLFYNPISRFHFTEQAAHLGFAPVEYPAQSPWSPLLQMDMLMQENEKGCEMQVSLFI